MISRESSLKDVDEGCDPDPHCCCHHQEEEEAQELGYGIRATSYDEVQVRNSQRFGHDLALVASPTIITSRISATWIEHGATCAKHEVSRPQDA